MTTPAAAARRIPADLPWALAIVAGISAGFHMWKVPPFVPLLREEFGIEPIVISGPATDNQVGIDIIKERAHVAAINAMTHGAELADLLQAAIGLGSRIAKASV